MKPFETSLELLPESFAAAAVAYRSRSVEEIRLRLGRQPALLIGGRELSFMEQTVTIEDLMCVIERATGASLHSAIRTMTGGYLNARGLRIGLCGQAMIQNGVITGFHSFSSLAIRIPRECRGICDGVIEELFADGFHNTLLISPPGGGKTTALRELIRCLADSGNRVGVVDERNELSATENGLAHFDLGRCSDVLVGVPKAEGAILLLRAMNPTILAMDEITQEQDAEAIRELDGCGVGILASAHAADAAELSRRPLYRKLLEAGTFSSLIIIRTVRGRRQYYTQRLSH